MELLTIIEFGTIVTTILMTFAGVPMCMGIWKSGDARFFPVGIFTYMTAPICIMSAFGFYSGDNLNLYLNCMGATMNIIYLCIYAMVEKDLGRFKKYATLIITFLVCVSTYIIQFVPIEDRAATLGSIGGIMFTSMLVAPIIDIYNTIKSGDTRNIMLPLLFAGSLNCLNWMLYGLLRNDYYTAVPNMPVLALNCVQFAVLFYYGMPKDTKKTD